MCWAHHASTSWSAASSASSLRRHHAGSASSSSARSATRTTAFASTLTRDANPPSRPAYSNGRPPSPVSRGLAVRRARDLKLPYGVVAHACGVAPKTRATKRSHARPAAVFESRSAAHSL